MLKLALDYENLATSGKSASEALAILRSDKIKYGAEIFDVFSSGIETSAPPSPVQHLNARELSPGMIINKDIMTTKGKLLVAADTEVTLPVFETLNNFARTGFIEEPFEVLIPESHGT